MNHYALGNLVRVSVTFEYSDGTDVDPTAVYCKVRDPSGNVATYTYGVDAGLVRDNAGDYHLDVDADERGEWLYRWYSTGTGQAAAEGAFTVEASLFTET